MHNAADGWNNGGIHFNRLIFKKTDDGWLEHKRVSSLYFCFSDNLVKSLPNDNFHLLIS